MLDILSEDEYLDFNSIDTSGVNIIMLPEDTNINLDDIIFDSDYEIIIKDTNNDGIVKDNIQGNRNNVEIIFDDFNTISNKLFDNMTLIDSIEIHLIFKKF